MSTFNGLSNFIIYIHSLYDFWSETLTDYIIKLNQKQKGDMYLINCASQEYYKVLNTKKISQNSNIIIINCEFKEEIAPRSYKIISVFAKRARGLMLRYASQAKVTTIEELKQFNYENYEFNKVLSSESNFVFTRPKPSKSKVKSKVKANKRRKTS